ncbi:MAG: hypothetical protein J6K63_07880, partial [Clostridia bacterium]|nr:hypothetical protein [Clostridia bacterium]
HDLRRAGKMLAVHKRSQHFFRCFFHKKYFLSDFFSYFEFRLIGSIYSLLHKIFRGLSYNTERIARENEYQSFLMTWKY